jgi:hypothetical protein
VNGDFWVGLLVGVVVAGVVGFLGQQILFWIGEVQRSGQPQTITLETEETPRQVVWRSILAGCALVCLFILVIILAVVLFRSVG